jgi:hypothetical protein
VNPPSCRTIADRAEIDLLAWELTGAIRDHEATCDVCAGDWPPCPKVGAAIEAAVDWVHGRRLRTCAERLRSDQDLLDFGRRLGFEPEQVRGLQSKWRAEEAALLEPEAAAAAA